MYQYSALYGLVRRTARRGEFVSKFDFRYDFPNLAATMRKYSKNEKLPNIYYKEEIKHIGGQYKPKLFENIPRSMDNMKIWGDFQSYKYWWEYKEDIRRMFVFSDGVVKNAQHKLADAALDLYGVKINFDHSSVLGRVNSTDHAFDESGITFIAVHSRRGDFLSPRVHHSKQYNAPTPAWFACCHFCRQFQLFYRVSSWRRSRLLQRSVQTPCLVEKGLPCE